MTADLEAVTRTLADGIAAYYAQWSQLRPEEIGPNPDSMARFLAPRLASLPDDRLAGAEAKVYDEADYQRLCQSLRVWLRTRAAHEPRFRDLCERGDPSRIAQQIANDADHSALLRRLFIDGREPLPEPPPLNMFSRPDYSAADRAALSGGDA